MNPAVSIIITTCNRAESLRATLESIGRVHVPPGLMAELLVVDNASTDDTAQVVRATRLPNLPTRYLYEPRRGQSNARNAGMGHTTGQIILFTDDDVRVPPEWIVGMAHPIEVGRASAVAGGVRLAPYLERPWLTPLQRGWLASTNFIEPTDPHTMVGANMAFSREVLKRVPAFDPELGPGGLGFGDDTLFADQVMHAGYVLAAALDTAVEHHFEDHRLRRKYFLETAKKRGRTRAYLAHHWDHRVISRPYRSYGVSVFRLIFAQARTRLVAVERCTDETMKNVRGVYFYQHYLVERRRPHNYAFNGLTRIRPLQCAAPRNCQGYV